MEDQKIIDLYWARSQEAITRTAEKYGSYCMVIACNILGNTEDAEECVNDTYLGAWNTIPPQRPAILSSFLGRLTRNLSLDRYRYNTAEKRNSNMTVALEELSGCVSGDESPEQTIDRKELVLAINDFLSTLSAQKRGIFICRYWYFDSVQQIASRYRITPGNVSVTLNRLRQKLRMYLQERGYAL